MVPLELNYSDIYKNYAIYTETKFAAYLINMKDYNAVFLVL